MITKTQQYQEVSSFDPLVLGKLYEIKPNWIISDGPDKGKQVDDDYLIAESILPVYVVGDETKSELLYDVILPDKTEFQLDEPNNRFIKTLRYELKDIDDVYRNIKSVLDGKRNEQLASNIRYVFPDTVSEGHIQTASVDIVKSLALSAVIRKQDNDDTPFVFRDFENTNHTLTPQEIIDLGRFIEIHQTDIYLKSWEFKNQLNGVYYDGALDDAGKAERMLSIIESVVY
jgi:hypothetical protein